jgi:mannosyltransferase
MATTAASPPRAPRVATAARSRLATGLGLALLVAVSAVLRTDRLDAGFWIDEGLSAGIADRPLLEIPGTLRQDGSPPLYYLLLHLWMAVTGARSETALHAFSLVVALLAVPAAFLLLRALVSTRAGWIGALLFAANPFLSQYAQEARMYALVVLLSLVTCATFVGAFAQLRGRRWTLGFATSLVALLYTHNWALFLAFALTAAFLALLTLAPDRRALWREGRLAAALAALAYAPWVPTLLFQVGHTGAPWARDPTLVSLAEAPTRLFGPTGQWLLLLAAGAGLAAVARSERRTSRTALVLALAGVLTLVVAWVASQVAGAFAVRYLAVALPPLLVLGALGLARAAGLGLAAAALLAGLWAANPAPAVKSNAREVAAAVAPALRPGDLVLSTQPEQVPVLSYYLAEVDGLRYATLTGPVRDLGVTDWRDGTERLRATSVARDLEPVLASVRPGQRIVLIAPDFSIVERWQAPWTELVRVRSAAWEERVGSDPGFGVVMVEPFRTVPRPNELRATVYVRR